MVTDTLFIVMPAYNEEENIEAVVRAWYPLIEDKGKGSRLVVADSGSSDQTHVILYVPILKDILCGNCRKTCLCTKILF